MGLGGLKLRALKHHILDILIPDGCHQEEGMKYKEVPWLKLVPHHVAFIAFGPRGTSPVMTC